MSTRVRVCSTTVCSSCYVLEEDPEKLHPGLPLPIFSDTEMLVNFFHNYKRGSLPLTAPTGFLMVSSEGVASIFVDVSQQRLNSVLNLKKKTPQLVLWLMTGCFLQQLVVECHFIAMCITSDTFQGT